MCPITETQSGSVTRPC